MNTETELVMDRIAKLLSKAKGTNNEHEAAIFAAKAAEMLAQHTLTETQLNARDADRTSGPIGRHPFANRVPDAWCERIIIGVAKVYFCAVRFTRRNGKPDQRSYEFVGREHNAVVAAMMAEYLFATVKRMAREHSTDRLIQTNFRKGAGDRLYARLAEMARQQRGPDAPTQHGDGISLMVMNEDRALEEFMSDTKTTKGRAHKYGNGSRGGYDAADRISLNTQVTETRASRMLA